MQNGAEPVATDNDPQLPDFDFSFLNAIHLSILCGSCLIFNVRQKQTMKLLITTALAAFLAASAYAAEVIRKPGLYTSPQSTTSLHISDAEIPKAVFTYVHADGKKTSSQFSLSPGGKWACWIQDEWTLWVYRAEDSFVLAITILPPKEGAQFRTATRKVSITEELDAIPAELRTIIKQ